jgi:hypothetical protein
VHVSIKNKSISCHSISAMVRLIVVVVCDEVVVVSYNNVCCHAMCEVLISIVCNSCIKSYKQHGWNDSSPRQSEAPALLSVLQEVQQIIASGIQPIHKVWTIANINSYSDNANDDDTDFIVVQYIKQSKAIVEELL